MPVKFISVKTPQQLAVVVVLAFVVPVIGLILLASFVISGYRSAALQGEEPDAVAAALAQRCNAAVAQVIGHTVLLYRRRSKDPTIKLPRATPPARSTPVT